MNQVDGANLAWALFASLFHIVALLSTVSRLVHRLRTSRMWWDDYMVVLPLCTNTVYFASLWVLYNIQYNLGEGSDEDMPPPTGISSFWVSQFVFLSVIWPCRISIALTLARVFPAFHKARRSAFFLAVMCFLSYLCCVFILTFECPNEDASWYKSVASDCHKTGRIFVGGIVAITLDVLMDSALILFPIITLWKVKLPQNLRRIIISAFSGSALTLISAIIFCIIRYAPNLDLDPSIVLITNLSGHLEAAISLTVANLLVIVTFLYRVFKRVHGLEGLEPPNARKNPSQVMEGQGTIGFAWETSIGRVSVIDTEDRPLSFTLTRISQLVWSSMRISEPPCLLSQNMSSD
ncbi:hypothetical protein BYT27DRAFT_6634168 [Phlegmacium glaucopus]|nr:hypothetical protein BYT27DRAFT_6634168 [Phlegmacium glaucopus]